MAQPIESMVDRSLEETVSELRRIFKEELCKPFPYDDCQRVVAKAGAIGAALIPDLALYFSDVAGYCSWGKKLLRLAMSDLSHARAVLERSFFEKHPAYLSLTALINETDTPVLWADLELYDKLRLELLAVIAQLLSAPAAAQPLLADTMTGATPVWSVSHHPSSQNRISD